MIYPSKIQKQLDEVKQIIQSWSINITFEHVLKWIMQFDNEDFDLAIRILKNLNVIGFKELNKGLEIAYSKLERKAIEAGTKITKKNTIFAGIGESSKSGNMISYNFRLTNNISESNFVIDEKTIEYFQAGEIKNIVLIDDILSTGTSVLNEITKLTERTIPLQVENIFVLTAVGMTEGLNKVKEETKGKIHVFSAFEYDVSDTVISLDSKFYDGIPYQDRLKVKEQLEYYGNSIYRKNKLGYGGIGGLIVFYYNTPNTTIPLVWGHGNSWIPLFKRATKLSGISAHYNEFDKAIAKKVKAKKLQEKNFEELTFYVEGRSDEIFFEGLIPRLIEELGYKKINVISLGGFHSKKLITNISKLISTEYLFLVDDSYYPSQKKAMDNLKNTPHLVIKPISNFLNVESLYNDDNISRFLPSKEELDDLNEVDKLLFIEKKLIKKALRKNSFDEIIENHIDNEKLNTFFSTVKKKLKEIRDKENSSTSTPRNKTESNAS